MRSFYASTTSPRYHGETKKFELFFWTFAVINAFFNVMLSHDTCFYELQQAYNEVPTCKLMGNMQVVFRRAFPIIFVFSFLRSRVK